jgi:hypothetical protein
MQSQQLLEPNHDVRVPSRSNCVVVNRAGGQAIDEYMEQILLNRSGDLPVCDDFRLCLGKMTSLRVQAQQPCRCERWRS